MPGLVSYYAPAGCKWILKWALPAVVASLPHRDGLYACYGTHPPGHPLYSWPMLPPEIGVEGLPVAGSEGVRDIGGVIPAGFAPSGYGPGSAGGYGAGGYGGFSPSAGPVVTGPVIATLGGGGVIAGPGIGPVVVANTPPAPTPVPEPSSFALFGFMAAALAWIKRKAR